MNFSYPCITASWSEHLSYMQFTKKERNTVSNDKDQQFSYDMLVITVANFAGELNIPVCLDNGCTVTVLPKNYCD